MYEKESLPELIGRVFEEQLHIEVPGPDADLLSSGLLDSFALVNLIAALETELDITIPLDDLDTDLEPLRTMRNIASYVTTLRGGSDVQVG